MNTFEDKKRLNEIMKELIEMRYSKTVQEVMEYVRRNKILLPTGKMKNYDMEDADKKEFYEKLMSLPYSQFLRLYQVQQESTPFSTKHNTKGDEFDNVMVVIDDSAWKQGYNFKDYFSENHSSEERYKRTSNLFYVVCSRARGNLAIVCVSELSKEAIVRIKNWFQEKNYIEISA